MRIMINGFGRIGRAAFRIALEDPAVEVVRINDLAPARTLAYLLKHDSTYGPLRREVEAIDGEIRVDGRVFPTSTEKEPSRLPHSDDGVEVVLDSTGVFLKREDAQRHLDAGAGKVLLSAPAKSPVDGDFILGVNDEQYDKERHHVVTIGSCTTNCLAPMVKVLHDRFTIVHGLMTTVHAYTAGQSLMDAPAKKLTRGRAAAANIVPTSTGAADMIGKIIPELDGKLSGMSLRVPVTCGSVTDLTCRVERQTTPEEVNAAFEGYARGRGEGILGLDRWGMVSSDIIGDTHSCVLSPDQTRVMEGTFVKIMGWYDNEWGFSQRLVDLLKRMV